MQLASSNELKILDIITFLSVFMCLLLLHTPLNLENPTEIARLPVKQEAACSPSSSSSFSFFSSWMKSRTNSMLKFTQEWVWDPWWGGALRVAPVLPITHPSCSAQLANGAALPIIRFLSLTPQNSSSLRSCENPGKREACVLFHGTSSLKLLATPLIPTL